ncbi:hypothetical protein EC988_006339 [Linderina pennispora]|nr:hypothetical protein EC988_006339 [Linderina pennispora]
MGLSDNEGNGGRPEFYHDDDDDVKPTVAPADDLVEDDIDDLDMAELGNKVWLVKVPKFLADKWRDVDGSGQEIGKVRIFDKPDAKGNSISLILPDTAENSEIPKDYNLRVVNNQVQNMLIFSELRDPKEVLKPTSTLANKPVPTALTGTIHHECTVTPTFNEKYQDIMRRRTVEAGKPVRSVRLLSDQGRNTSMFRQGENTDFVTAHKKPTGDSRMARMDRKDLMDLLFSAFERYPYWSFKGLVEQTKQPAAFLKEVLADVAILNKRGPYAATYSIKPEFRNSTNTAPDMQLPPPPAETNDMDDDANFDEDEDFEDV